MTAPSTGTARQIAERIRTGRYQPLFTPLPHNPLAHIITNVGRQTPPGDPQ
jgi:hypothetical protein